ncbi:ATP synthase F1 subunit gamma [Candidatus Uhrbacteria bacterium]|nr:ATP synthase F1 subunit gamma [Candidatus Uhrbacteria bacterium]
MAIPSRIIKKRIRSVRNTKKITKAMELVAASKMRRAISAVLGTRPFAGLAWELLGAIGGKIDTSLHPLLHSPNPEGKILSLVFTSDRGLCGGFNAKVLKEVLGAVGGSSDQHEVIAVGRRGEQAMHRVGVFVSAGFVDLSNHPKFTDTLPIAKLVTDAFLSGKYVKVMVHYTDFVSPLSQRPRQIQLLPITSSAQEYLADVIPAVGRISYTFEPTPQAVLHALLPRVVEVMIFQALLESSASEHSARMMAMRSASDAASEMIDDLTLTYNQARQAGITREIAEISSGKAALE